MHTLCGFQLGIAMLLASVIHSHAQIAPQNATNGVRNICTYPHFPFMACTSDASTVPDGFDYDLFIAATVSLKWSEGVNYTIKCMEKKQVLDALLAGDAATCYMAIGGIQVDADLIENGLEYTWSYYQGGLRILTTASTSTGGMWAFLDTFTWQLWVLLAGTAAAVPLIGWIAEGIVWGKERHDSLDAPTYRGFKGLGSMVWHFSTFFVSFEPLDFRTWANRLLAIAYGFLLVVVIALYTANTAAQVALTTVNYKVNSLADLKGQAVGTTAELAPTVRGLGLAPSVFPWGTGADEVAVKDDLLMGAYTAVILDNAWVDYAATNDTACQLKAVGPLFNMTNYAFAFPKGTPASTLTEWDLLLTDLQGRLFIIDKLIQRWVDLPSACKETGEIDDSNLQVVINQIAGLWVILSVTVALCLFWGFYRLIQERRMRRTVVEFKEELSKSLPKRSISGTRKKSEKKLEKLSSLRSDTSAMSSDSASTGVDSTPTKSITQTEQRHVAASQMLVTEIESLERSLSELKTKVRQAKQLYVWHPPSSMT